MDIPQLIKEVRKRPEIWNQKSMHYYNRDVVALAWQEISVACDMPYDGVKCKWKHLRDNFRKEFKKCLKDGGYQSDPDKYESGWVWFKSLNFLADQLSAKKLAPQSKNGHSQKEDENINLGIQASSSSLDNEDSRYEIKPPADTDESQIHTDDDSTPPVHNVMETYVKALDFAQKRRKGRDELDDRFFSKKRRKDCKRNQQDDTYHFLMSLLGPMRRLSYDKEMFVRLKMQEIVFNETTKDHNHLSQRVEFKAECDIDSPLAVTPTA